MLAITLVLCVLAIQTIFVAVNLVLYSNDVVEAGRNADFNYHIREGADQVYESVNEGRAKFYNSANPFIKWLSNMNNNLIRLPLGLLIILSPALFIYGVRKYHMSKRARRARVY